MSVASIEFILLLLICGAFYFQLPGRGSRLAFFALANTLALSLLIPNWESLAALAIFLVSGYGVAKLLERRPSGALFTTYLVALLAAFLVLKKYVFLSFLLPESVLAHPIGIIGLSYMLFRQIHFIVDSMQGQIERGTFSGYLNYQLNLFGILSGPIQRYQEFYSFWRDPQPILADRHDLLKSILRINVGVLKLALLGAFFFRAYEVSSNTLVQVADGVLLQISPLKRVVYFAIMFYSFPAYIYFNFSGYCDIVIAGARLFGIKMPENFDQPYFARNMIDFWNRFHRTLSHWIRDYIFMPLYKGALERRPTQAEPLSILFLFVALFLAGLWHGSTINWVVYGALNGLGVAAAKLWEIILVKRRGRAGLREYMNSRIILVIAVIANMHFVCLTCLFFAEDMHRTLKAVGVFLGI